MQTTPGTKSLKFCTSHSTLNKILSQVTLRYDFAACSKNYAAVYRIKYFLQVHMRKDINETAVLHNRDNEVTYIFMDAEPV
jgi:hypothetical protein